ERADHGAALVGGLVHRVVPGDGGVPLVAVRDRLPDVDRAVLEMRVFPQALGLAATFDPDLVEDVAAVIREQLRAVGARHCLAPVLDVARDPRWGRVEETFGKEPFLVGTLGAAYVRGLQTGNLRGGVLATGKHFLGHASPEGGRNHGPLSVGERDLRDVYAEPFAVAIAEAGLATVMNSYSAVDGLAPAGSRRILTDLLRGELGVGGMVVADYFAVSLLMTHHHVAADKRGAAVLALEAGLDVEMPATDCFGEPLRAAIDDGEVSVDTVDTAVRRVLGAKFALGLFEDPYVEEERAALAFETPPQRALARRAAQEAVVLLTNNGVLPLSATVRRIAVVGPGADDVRLLQGDYHYPSHHRSTDGPVEAEGHDDGAAVLLLPTASGGEWQPGAFYTEHVTPLAGLRSAVGTGVEVAFSPGCAVTGKDTAGIAPAAALVAASEVVVVVAGRSGLGRNSTVGEARDATDLHLTGVQTELVRVCAATGTPLVVVVMSGRVHALTDVEPLADALVYCAPLGEEAGSALADVLVGAVSPSGRLPVTLPRAVGQVPRYLGHRSGGSSAMFYGEYSDAPTSPLFAFGHGLSYTAFDYRDLAVLSGDTRADVEVCCTIENVGERPGAEVVQLYVRDLVASVARPELQLVGVARVELEPGAARTVTFRVHPSRLAFTDAELRRVLEPGDFAFSVGASSADLRLSATTEIVGDPVEHPLADLRPTVATVEEALDPPTEAAFD
ncbi:MAG TPA: glycoside hydrolase family 3 N-terminal domain-containing protein, partial [Acidimicrobiales bacterium]|nr:glycoside hydrolase family 3 N-terminal domain-containing protein [Acidimicrobiales bacterium]